ncbi:LptF/LptG family permease [Plebeiibacterium sediminum]|uniref:LptF/LptG family permease n=1 Tax=Plebeiibacterium sediminum TaxID=2992112 RepID=A0AAE3M3Z2_9BACT|nr:LptF/LptG family permease [Plebeiobacterium sediminum]MCW3786704.1 LptF/LptG family permease [Plebeiobacterium sediminum]
MKKLHIFILKSYLGPLVMTFFISLFILVMQILWRYVDDLVGKGLEVSVLIELLFYASLQVIPMALPLAILLASLMAFGNLGENYELTALKSAGISLQRIMAPLIIFSVIISFGAFKFSNNVLPVANLKFTSLMWSVRQSRPEFDIKEKIFYDGLENFSIKIDHKSKNGEMLYDIMIYDHRNEMAGNSNVTIADSGKLQFTEDNKYLKLTLFDGVQYNEEADDGRKRNKNNYQFREDHFKQQVAMIPLQGMEFNRMDESNFSSYGKMKNLEQISHDTDSLLEIRQKHIAKLKPQMEKSYFIQRKTENNRIGQKNDSIASTPEPQIETYEAVNVDSVFDSFGAEKKVMILSNAIRRSRDAKTKIDDQLNSMGRVNYHIVRHKIEWHRKFTLSIACLIFFFIGAPLGAIIRKGGLGMPVVISVVFFIIYYIIDTFGYNVSKKEVWPPHFGIWLSSVVLFPIGVFLTYKAATDSAILNSDAYLIFFQKLFKKFKRNKKK